MLDFSGKAVLITGAGAGIGQSAARAFARAGARVALGSVSPSAGAAAQALASEGYVAVFVQGDVGDEQSAEAIVSGAVQALGGLDVVVNCAGVVTGGSVEETSLSEWERVMRTNATGTFLISRAAMPHLRRSRGVIVNVSSLVAIRGVASRAAYSASKGAVLSLSRAMAADHLKDGVRVNCVCPGTVMTPSLDARIQAEPDPEAARARYVSRQPIGRLGEPDEIATAILFAASSEAGFMNGANITIDGAASL
jgi:NAD(P)-dependent dehydrogenase (short-subunit alcohol dehydrogenase family)